MLYTNHIFRIEILMTKTLLKVKNLNSGHKIKINVKDIVKAYDIKESLHFNTKTILARTLYFLGKNLNNLNIEVKNNKKQYSAISRLKNLANELENEYFKEYHNRSIFKNLFNL